MGRRPVDRQQSASTGQAVSTKENGSSKVTHKGGCTLLGDAKAGVPEVGDVLADAFGKRVGLQECQPEGLSAHCFVRKAYIIHIGGGLAILSSFTSQPHCERAVQMG